MATSLASIAGPSRTALVIIDVQNDFCHPDGTHGRRGAPVERALPVVDAINRLVAVARSAGVRIVYVRTEHSAETDTPAWHERGGSRIGGSDSVRKGTWGADWFGVKPEGTDQIVVKHRYSAFIGTDLDQRLRAANVETVIAAGTVGHGCVESTAREACMRDYYSVLASDCTLSFSDEDHESLLARFSGAFGMVATSENLTKIWSGARALSTV